MKKEEVEFTVQCAVCTQHYDNWVGSTPCCGSIAFLVNDDGSVENKIRLFSSLGVVELEINR
jgi:hypothetical protein